ncbi:hypothetical protein CR513_38051, partial [Mucuna pruriens]
MGKSQKKIREGGREKSKSKSKSRYKNVEYRYCHKTENMHKNCFLRKKENKCKNGKSKEKNHEDYDDRVTTTTSNDLVILRDFESVNLVSDERMWIIDNSATLHVTSRKKFFTSYTSSDFGMLKMGMLKMGNDVVSNVIGVGDVVMIITLVMENGNSPKTRISFKKHPPSRKSELLEFVYSDVCGPLKTKDQVLEKFKQFQALVERQSGKKVKCIRFDNGGEYCGPFDVYCKKQVALNTKVPNKIWFGKDVKYDHLQVFDCKAFLHVPKDERYKLDTNNR